jgi:hypothetical protein
MGQHRLRVPDDASQMRDPLAAAGSVRGDWRLARARLMHRLAGPMVIALFALAVFGTTAVLMEKQAAARRVRKRSARRTRPKTGQERGQSSGEAKRARP